MEWIDPNKAATSKEVSFLVDSMGHDKHMVMWAYHRYCPLSVFKTGSKDIEALDLAGIPPASKLREAVSDPDFMVGGSAEQEESRSDYMNMINRVVLDVVAMFGGPKFTRWVVGRKFLMDSYSEIMAPLTSEADLEKRPQVLIKKGELFKMVEGTEKELAGLESEIFGKDNDDDAMRVHGIITVEQRARATGGAYQDE